VGVEYKAAAAPLLSRPVAATNLLWRSCPPFSRLAGWKVDACCAGRPSGPHPFCEWPASAGRQGIVSHAGEDPPTAGLERPRPADPGGAPADGGGPCWPPAARNAAAVLALRWVLGSAVGALARRGARSSGPPGLSHPPGGPGSTSRAASVR